MTTLERVRESVAQGAQALRRIIGAPDYDRYVAHMRARHPDQEPLSAQNFARAQLVNRYARPGSRCC